MKNALYRLCALVKGQHEELGCVVPALRLWICFLQRWIVFYSCFLSLFASTLEGYYVDDALQGQGIYTYEDGVVLHGTYVDGELNGPAQEYDSDGRLIFKGQYKDNIRHGVCWIYYPVGLTSRSLFCWIEHSCLFSAAEADTYQEPAIQKETQKPSWKFFSFWFWIIKDTVKPFQCCSVYSEAVSCLCHCYVPGSPVPCRIISIHLLEKARLAVLSLCSTDCWWNAWEPHKLRNRAAPI